MFGSEGGVGCVEDKAIYKQIFQIIFLLSLHFLQILQFPEFDHFDPGL